MPFLSIQHRDLCFEMIPDGYPPMGHWPVCGGCGLIATVVEKMRQIRELRAHVIWNLHHRSGPKVPGLTRSRPTGFPVGHLTHCS